MLIKDLEKEIDYIANMRATAEGKHMLYAEQLCRLNIEILKRIDSLLPPTTVEDIELGEEEDLLGEVAEELTVTIDEVDETVTLTPAEATVEDDTEDADSSTNFLTPRQYIAAFFDVNVNGRQREIRDYINDTFMPDGLDDWFRPTLADMLEDATLTQDSGRRYRLAARE
jgi:hypothetical protein